MTRRTFPPRMNDLRKPTRPALCSLSLAVALLLGRSACGGSQNEGPQRATEEALAATESAPDTAAEAPADTADTAGTYRTHGESFGWYVLSGSRGNNIFYERVEARDSTMKVVRMFYDRSQEARFDSIVREVSNSLEG